MRPEDLSRPVHPFSDRHLGSSPEEVETMLESLGLDSLEDLAGAVVPGPIRLQRPLDLPPAESEKGALAALAERASENQVWRSYLGMGYYGTVTPPVIRRNVLENPGWYTQYTPYQSEISQGRLEMLLNFQTLIAELTGLPLANASMLDEATAAAEAMAMCHAAHRGKRSRFLVADDAHPQTLAVIRTRARALGWTVEVVDPTTATFDEDVFGILLQTPATDGALRDPSEVIARATEAGAHAVVATDLLALCLLRSPGDMGAAIAIGSSQRFGVPLGYGGPHAAFLATRTDLERHLPGRIVGVSKDAQGRPALRLARQTREQHIRREKATSNICTAQVLLAIMAACFAVYHGPEGLRALARRVHGAARLLATGLRSLGLELATDEFFDTIRVRLDSTGDGDRAAAVLRAAAERQINLRNFGDGSLGVALDETVTADDLADLLAAFAEGIGAAAGTESGSATVEVSDDVSIPTGLQRSDDFLAQEVFNCHHTEHEMLRYLKRLESRDLSLVHSMIPLGSCTMKLNATAEMLPITWAEWGGLHPYAPRDQARGYERLFAELKTWLGEITGLPAVSLQPNAGSQGEYAGLLAIRGYHEARGDERDICLIPTSAHGTNPASAVLAGLKVVAVQCDEAGNIDLADLEAKADQHAEKLAALMITYPSTHGVFETTIEKVCAIVHERGGQVYLDGANLNAQVGLCRPGDYGGDVCHLNLHKTFCIPHGGGGPGMGPICAAEHLAPHLPTDPLESESDRAASPTGTGPVASAAEGSPGILPIPWMYIAMMGPDGLRRASELAVLNANYMAKRLASHYKVLYTGETGFVAHEFILDLREFRDSAGVQVEDVAKRLMDFGFHAPTMSWPVAGTIMVEPTESESKDELDRFCDAMIQIREEIRAIEEGRSDRDDNPLKGAPHTAVDVTADAWPHPYGREEAAFPLPWVRDRKFWPSVGRVDNAWGDRNLACTCDSVEAYAEQ